MVTAAVIAAAIAFAGALILALGLTPLARRLAERQQAVDHPGHRRVNTSPVPRGGGLATAAAFVVVAAIVLFVDARIGIWPTGKRLDPSEMIALLAGGGFAAILGTLDDWYDLRARYQLVGQVALALFAIALGISVDIIANPFAAAGAIPITGAFGIGFALFWIVGMINSINFIDGLDGLSSGIGAIAAVTLGAINFIQNQPAVGVMCFTLAGALFGFLKWNWHPAVVFSGTSGVMFLGYTLAVLAVLGTAKVAVALLVLGVPIIDTFYIILRRVSRGRSPFTPDRKHLHHRLLDLGLSHRQTVVLIYSICIGFGGLSLVLTNSGQALAFTGIVVLGGLLIFLLDRAVVEAEEDLQADATEPGVPDGTADGTPPSPASPLAAPPPDRQAT